jgi:hypothetical protein
LQEGNPKAPQIRFEPQRFRAGRICRDKVSRMDIDNLHDFCYPISGRRSSAVLNKLVWRNGSATDL